MTFTLFKVVYNGFLGTLVENVAYVTDLSGV